MSITPGLSLSAEQEFFRSVIQRIATGPELSKDISENEARRAMNAILENRVDPVQSAIFFIALRMKRESMPENIGVLKSIRDHVKSVTADVDEVLDIADPFDGYNRTLPASPFLSALLAEFGIATVSHGLDRVGPKYGLTPRHVFQACGIDVDLTPSEAAKRLSNPSIGWSYIDQASYAPKLHDLVDLRQKIIKRQVITTTEVLAKPVSGKVKTHFVTGYVHKPYPPIYAELARQLDFDSCLLMRGIEGGVIPSLRQEGVCYQYHNKKMEMPIKINPATLGIQSDLRAPPLPDDLPKQKNEDSIAIGVEIKAVAKAAADAGIAALEGEGGIVQDSLILSAGLILYHLNRFNTLTEAADALRDVLASGKAANRLQ